MRAHALTFLLLTSVHCLQGADTFSSAFTQGKVQGNATLFFYNIDKKEQENAYATALGGFLKYTTDDSKATLCFCPFSQLLSRRKQQEPREHSTF